MTELRYSALHARLTDREFLFTFIFLRKQLLEAGGWDIKNSRAPRRSRTCSVYSNRTRSAKWPVLCEFSSFFYRNISRKDRVDRGETRLATEERFLGWKCSAFSSKRYLLEGWNGGTARRKTSAEVASTGSNGRGSFQKRTAIVVEVRVKCSATLWRRLHWLFLALMPGPSLRLLLINPPMTFHWGKSQLPRTNSENRVSANS